MQNFEEYFNMINKSIKFDDLYHYITVQVYKYLAV